MNTEREIIGGEHRKRGNLEIEHPFSLSPEGPRRIITEEGIVKWGKEIQNLMTEEGNKAKMGADIVLNHITGTSPQNIAFMKQSRVEEKLAVTAQKIDVLIGTAQKEVKIITKESATT